VRQRQSRIADGTAAATFSGAVRAAERQVSPARGGFGRKTTRVKPIVERNPWRGGGARPASACKRCWAT